MIFACIPVHNRVDYTIACLKSLFAQELDLSVIVCDDGSNDSTRERISTLFPDVVLLSGDGNLWWAGATNKCIEYALSRAAEGDYVLTINNDTELLPGSLKGLLQHAINKPHAIFALLNLFYNHPNQIENSGFIRFFGGLAIRRLHRYGQQKSERAELLPVDGLAGKGVLIPVKVFHKIGLYDSKNLPHYHADLEFSIRAKRAGFPLYLDTGHALLSHQELTGVGMKMTAPNWKEFIGSFSNIRSTHHLPSLKNYLKAVHGNFYFAFLVRDLLFIWLGFIKRYVKHLLVGWFASAKK